MSKLKQEILEVVQKGENVLQSWQGTPNARDGEGNVYECRFDAPVYDPDTGDGVTCSIGDLRKYTRTDGSGNLQTFIIEKDTNAQELVMNTDGAVKFGLAGVELDVEKAVTDGLAFTNFEKLLKNNNTYFMRQFVAEETSGGSAVQKVNSASTTHKAFIGDADNTLKESWSEIASRLWDTPTNTTDTAEAGQLIYSVINTSGDVESRAFTKKFFGKITVGDTVPAGSIFYYDGVEAIFTPAGGGAKVAKAGSKGYYLYVSGTPSDVFDVDAEAVEGSTSSLFIDLTSDRTGITEYVLGQDAGGSAVSFENASGFHKGPLTTVQDLTMINFAEFSEVLTAAEVSAITNPTGTNDFWTKMTGATEPVDNAGSANSGFAVTGGDTLTDADYWNLISEGFIEDHDVGVSPNGLVGAQNGGEFSRNEANGTPKTAYTGYTPVVGSNTVRVVEVQSTTGSTGATEVEVTVEFKHGLEPGDAVTIAGTGVSEVDGAQTVGSIGGVTGTDLHTFSLAGISKTALGSATDISASSGQGTASVSGIPHIVWGDHVPPTTDQALVYRH